MRGSALAICCLVFLGMALPALAAPRQVIVLLWHGLQWDQISTFTCPQPLAWGLMNTKAGGGHTLSGGYLAIGAGARAVGLAGAGEFWQEDPQGLYSLRTGLAQAAIVNPKIALLKAAQTVSYELMLGALGTALGEAGVKSAAFGNSDSGEKVRWAPLIIMDQGGRVFQGSVGEEILVKDAGYPFGIKTNYELLAEKIIKSPASLIAVDLGDPYRYSEYEPLLLPGQKEVLQERMVGESLAFLERIRKALPEAIILITSPYPPPEKAKKGQWLTPLLCVGWQEGLFTAGTTKWPGLITNMDLAPLILDLLQAEHGQHFIGRTAAVQPHEQPTEFIASMEKRLLVLHTWRGPVLRTVVICQIILYLFSLFFIIIKAPLPPLALSFWQHLLLAFSALPLALLLAAGPTWLFLLWLFLLAGLFSRRWHYLQKLLVIATSTWLLISADVLGGSWLMRYSYLGYDPIGGARFYGLGNELMGILVGSTIISWALLCQLYPWQTGRRGALGIFIFGLVLIVIGAPALGTNVGGSICALLGFGFTWLFLEKKGNRQTVLGLFLISGLVLCLFFLQDSLSPVAKQSHMGQTVALFKRGGFPALQLIVQRKVAMNLRLLRSSIWSKALLVAVAVMGASFIWPSSFIRWLMQNYPALSKGIGGVVVASVAAFLFNDSGVVAAATCLFFSSTALLILALGLKHDLAAP